MAEKIDAHHHLWRYNAAEYGWLDDDMRALRRDFLPKDLVPELAAAGIDGTVAVQARQTMDETRWLLDMADECEAIRGVVGWAPIAGEDFPGVMEEFERPHQAEGAAACDPGGAGRELYSARGLQLWDSCDAGQRTGVRHPYL